MINFKNFDSNLLKIDKKNYKGVYIIIKKLVIVKIFTV